MTRSVISLSELQMETPLPYDPPNATDDAPPMRCPRLLRWHVVAFVFFLPFASMLAIHRYLGLSDAMMVAPTPGQPHSLLYNMLMICAFYIGVGGFILHFVLIAERTPAWVFGKLAVLVALWAALIWALP